MREAVICEPLRTAVGRFGGALKDVSVQELAATVIGEVMARTGIDPASVDDVILGQGYANGEAPAIGRVAALDAGFPVDDDRRAGRPPLRLGPPGRPLRGHAGADRRERRGPGRRRRVHEPDRVLHDGHALGIALGARDDVRPPGPGPGDRRRGQLPGARAA